VARKKHPLAFRVYSTAFSSASRRILEYTYTIAEKCSPLLPRGPFVAYSIDIIFDMTAKALKTKALSGISCGRFVACRCDKGKVKARIYAGFGGGKLWGIIVSSSASILPH
jgi:hypothetical protein